MSIWAAIAGGAGEYLRQSDKAKEEERIRLKEEALAKLQAEKDAKEEERYLDELQRDRDRQIMEAEDKSLARDLRKQERAEDQAESKRRYDQNYGIQTQQLGMQRDSAKDAKESRALYQEIRNTQLSQAAAAKEAEKMQRKESADYKAVSEAFNPVLEELSNLNSTLSETDKMKFKNSLVSDLEASLKNEPDVRKRDMAIKARVAFIIDQMKKANGDLSKMIPELAASNR